MSARYREALRAPNEPAAAVVEVLEAARALYREDPSVPSFLAGVPIEMRNHPEVSDAIAQCEVSTAGVLLELFEEAKNDKTPIMVERVVNDIDEIVRYVRFDGWQNTHAGEREVKLALRKTLFKYKLHQDQELFDRAYGSIRQYY